MSTNPTPTLPASDPAGRDTFPWRPLAWAGAALQAGAVLATLALGAWREAAVLGSFLLSSALLLLLPLRLPGALLALAVLALGISAGGSAWDWYGDFWWFDDLVHFLNLLAMVAASMHFLARAPVPARPGGAAFVILAAVLGLALALAWEAVETFFLDLEAWDTTLDVAWGVLGAALGGRLAGRLVEEQGLPAPRWRLSRSRPRPGSSPGATTRRR